MTSDVYQTLDLSRYRNAAADVLGAGQSPPVGTQRFHGLPFEIGPAERAFVAPEVEAVCVAVERAAHTVVIAHRLLGTRIDEGGPIGDVVAEYVFRMADGSAHTVPIRERFEIADLVEFGRLPFLALPDQKNGVRARWSGNWSDAGYRQTEAQAGWPQAYYLWCWRNPTPDVALRSIDLVPNGRRFVVAAITLGLSDEHPFVRSGAVPVRIDLDAGLTVAELHVEVDRGVASYPYPLPARSAEDFLADGFAGWGEARNESAQTSYVEVAAIPSATLTVQSGSARLGSVRWGDVLERRAATGDRVRVQVVEDGRNWVETTVVDDATGEPVPCRVHFRSVDGVPYQPHGHHGHVNSDNDTWHIDVGGDLRLGQASYAYITGRCQGWLPRGEVVVDVARGYEYEPLRQRVTIAPGQQRLELRLKRMVDMNARRWFSGDSHVHFLSTQGSLREAQAEDVNVVNLLQSQWGSLFTNTEDFTGEPAVSRDGRTIVWVSQENRQHVLGHMILMGLTEPVYPWCSDGPSEAELGGTLETTLAAWADACHAQGGTVVLPHFPNPNAEPAALVATGRIDGVEMIRNDPYYHLEYYRYLNSGYRLPLVGGTDKMSSQVAVGQYRTYVRIPADEEFSHASWCSGLKHGRTFLSGGPLLEFSVDGAQIGDTVHLPAGGGTVEVAASARSILPIHSLQIVCNGEVVAQADELDGTRQLKATARVPIARDSWLCARVGGPNYEQVAHHDVWQRGVFAHTSPIYVACGESWARSDPAGLQYLLTLVDGSLEYMRQMAPRHPSGTVTHHHGEHDHQAWLERPFLEARAALTERLRTTS
jgi:hypothetical protein